MLAHPRLARGVALADPLGEALRFHTAAAATSAGSCSASAAAGGLAADGPTTRPAAELLGGVERTACGAAMLPDRSRFGPLYWAVLERRDLE